MYYSRIEPAAVIDRTPDEQRPGAGATSLGLAMLVVALPLLATRALLWAVTRDLYRAVRFGGSVGQAALDAVRSR